MLLKVKLILIEQITCVKSGSVEETCVESKSENKVGLQKDIE